MRTRRTGATPVAQLLREAHAALCRAEASLESPATRHKAVAQIAVAESLLAAARAARKEVVTQQKAVAQIARAEALLAAARAARKEVAR